LERLGVAVLSLHFLEIVFVIFAGAYAYHETLPTPAQIQSRDIDRQIQKARSRSIDTPTTAIIVATKYATCSIMISALIMNENLQKGHKMLTFRNYNPRKVVELGPSFEDNFLSNLPFHFMVDIFSVLNLGSLTTLSTVCKSFATALRNEELWYQLILKNISQDQLKCFLVNNEYKYKIEGEIFVNYKQIYRKIAPIVTYTATVTQLPCDELDLTFFRLGQPFPKRAWQCIDYFPIILCVLELSEFDKLQDNSEVEASLYFAYFLRKLNTYVNEYPSARANRAVLYFPIDEEELKRKIFTFDGNWRDLFLDYQGEVDVRDIISHLTTTFGARLSWRVIESKDVASQRPPYENCLFYFSKAGSIQDNFEEFVELIQRVTKRENFI